MMNSLLKQNAREINFLNIINQQRSSASLNKTLQHKINIKIPSSHPNFSFQSTFLKKSFLSQNTSTQVQALNPKITKIHIQESPKRGQQEFLTIN